MVLARVLGEEEIGSCFSMGMKSQLCKVEIPMHLNENIALTVNNTARQQYWSTDLKVH